MRAATARAARLTLTVRRAQVALRVEMACAGCSGAVKRVLDKTPEVESYDISLETQKVVVRSSLTAEELLEKISKTGKATTLWKE